MKYRLADVLAEETLSTAATEVINVDLQDPISRIEIFWKPLLNAAAMTLALPGGISRIEIVDGSDVLHSLNGRANQALCLYDRHIPTLNAPNLVGGGYAYCTMGIDFGRWLFDPMLALDPKRFRNLQLKISHDITAMDATASSHKLTVKAHVFDEKVISPVGFLMAKEHGSWSPGANDAYHAFDLPLDYPIRQLILRNYLTDVDPTNVADYLKISEDNDKRIPFHEELTDYCHRMRATWTQIIEGCTEYAYLSSGQYWKYMTPTDEFCQVSILPAEASQTPYVEGATVGGLFKRQNNPDTVGCAGMIFGYLPHHCIQVPFGDQNDLDDWYEVANIGSLKARVQAAASWENSEITAILQQLRRY